MCLYLECLSSEVTIDTVELHLAVVILQLCCIKRNIKIITTVSTWKKGLFCLSKMISVPSQYYFLQCKIVGLSAYQSLLQASMA